MWQTWDGWQSFGSSDRARRASLASSAYIPSSSAMRRPRSAERWAMRATTWAQGVSPRARKATISRISPKVSPTVCAGTRRLCLSLLPDRGGARRSPVDGPAAHGPGAVSAGPGGRVIAVGALGLAACCALPILVGSGVVASLAGMGSGSGLLVVAGLVLAGLVGFGWWRRRTCSMPTGTGQASRSGPVDEEERRRAQPH